LWLLQGFQTAESIGNMGCKSSNKRFTQLRNCPNPVGCRRRAAVRSSLPKMRLKGLKELQKPAQLDLT
jgi:hypothetical protein